MKTLDEKIREKFPKHSSLEECLENVTSFDLAGIIIEHDWNMQKIISELQAKQIDLSINVYARNKHHKLINYKDQKFAQLVNDNFEQEWNENIIPSYSEVRSRVAFKNYSRSTEMDPLTYLSKYEAGNSVFGKIRSQFFTIP